MRQFPSEPDDSHVNCRRQVIGDGKKASARWPFYILAVAVAVTPGRDEICGLI